MRERSPSEGVLVYTEFLGRGCRVAVDFATASAPLLAIGEEVQLSFSGGPHPASSAASSAAGRTTFRRDGDLTCRYQFEVPERWSGVISPFVNRRGGMRVAPGAAWPIEASLTTLDGELQVSTLVRDLSALGLGAVVASEEEARLCAAVELRVTLRLPRDDAPLQLAGLVRYRSLAGSNVHYGIEFLGAGESGRDPDQRRLEHFLRERQLEALRERNLAPS